MDGNENLVHLIESKYQLTDTSEKDVYRVQSGTVYVYIAPVYHGKPDRRIWFCDVEAGRLIPTLNYMDPEHTRWCFVLVPKDEAVIVRLPDRATSILHRNFIVAAGLDNSSNETFQQRLVEYYRHGSLKDEVHIGVDKKNRPIVRKETTEVIVSPFREKGEPITGGSPLYRVMSYACKCSGIDLAGEKRIRALCGPEATVPDIAGASRFACREIVLDHDWYRRDCGTIIGFIDDRPVACVPRGQIGYTIYSGDTDRAERLTPQTAKSIYPRAYVLYRPLPGKSVDTKELIAFGMKSIRRADLLWVAVLGLAGTLLGLLLPWLNQKVFDDYIPLGRAGQMAQICALIASFMVSSLFLDIVRRLSEYRIGSHVGYDLQNAVYYRVFGLPESFFRRYDSADLAQRLAYMGPVANTFVSSTLVAGLAALFSLLYLHRMFAYAPKLSRIALVMLAAYGVLLFLIGRKTISIDMEIERSKGEASSRLYQFITGIEKIRIAGMEDRAVYEYAVPFAERQSLEISKNRFSAWAAVLSGSAGVVFSMVFYYIIVHDRLMISAGGFMGFHAAFGAFSAAILGMVGAAETLYQMKPIYERVKPVLTTATEDNGEKAVLESLRGEIWLQNVKFAYDKNGANILNGIDLTIKPGEYLGIVGASGCGKSTLLKLLLGFEDPDQGRVLYDGMDLRMLDKRELRKKMGVVLQDGRLIAGSIYENITITAPDAPVETVMETIGTVGLMDDIQQMPMGVHTVLSENAGTISGGQKQRILIARAVLGKPSVLIFDEATSALDNVAQAAVSENLDKMHATRIVVAHRLSTIKNCDRIIVLDDGVIAEQGTYRELMDKGGLFRRLADRQLV